uniref:SRCR domain-containing protein n=1 Tax=Strongyloides venezuelensis TaxID=75913 RepID=A0A0K0FLY4_STRVS
MDCLKFVYIVVLSTCIFIALLIASSYLFVKQYEYAKIFVEEFKDINEKDESNFLTNRNESFRKGDSPDFYNISISIKRNISVPINRSKNGVKSMKINEDCKKIQGNSSIKLPKNMSDRNLNIPCPIDNKFNVGSNNKCFKYIRRYKKSDNPDEVCRTFNAQFFEIKNNMDINILKNLVEGNVNDKYIDIGIRCDSKSVCKYLSSNKTVSQDLKVITPKNLMSCIILYNTKSKSLECKKESKARTKYSYFCQKENSTATHSCSIWKIRASDGFCYNKLRVKNHYSKQTAEKICNEMKMKLPILESSNSMDIGKVYSQKMKTPLWIDMYCEHNTTLKCKWKNESLIDIKNHFSDIVIKQRKEDENCVILDNKFNGTLFANSDARARASSESEKSPARQCDNEKNIATTNLFSKPNQFLSKIFTKSETYNTSMEEK